MATRTVDIEFITKPGCHLCDEARPVLEGAVAELRDAGHSLTLVEHNMLDDERLTSVYQEDIPVVLIDGKRHSYWRVDHDRFIQAVLRRAKRRWR